MTVLAYETDYVDLQIVIQTFDRLYQDFMPLTDRLVIFPIMRPIRVAPEEVSLGYTIHHQKVVFLISVFVVDGLIVVQMLSLIENEENFEKILNIEDLQVEPGGSLHDLFQQTKGASIQATFAPHQYFEAAEFAMYALGKSSTPPVIKWMTDDTLSTPLTDILVS